MRRRRARLLLWEPDPRTRLRLVGLLRDHHELLTSADPAVGPIRATRRLRPEAVLLGLPRGRLGPTFRQCRRIKTEAGRPPRVALLDRFDRLEEPASALSGCEGDGYLGGVPDQAALLDFVQALVRGRGPSSGTPRRRGCCAGSWGGGELPSETRRVSHGVVEEDRRGPRLPLTRRPEPVMRLITRSLARTLGLLAGLLVGLLAAGPALAQDTDQEPEPEPPEAELEPPKQRVKWGTEPFVRPALGASVLVVDGETFTAGLLGAQGGLHYWQKKPDPKVIGTARVLGQVVLGAGANGWEVRAGTFAGPWYKIIGLRTGPDFFYNVYNYGTVYMVPTPGLSWPVIGLLDFDVINFHAGVEPGFYFSDREPVTWSDQLIFGFGHEFTYLAGAGIDIQALGLSVSYTDRITAFGRQKGIGVGIRLGG